MTVTRRWQPRPSDTFIPDLWPSDTFVPDLCTGITCTECTDSECPPRPSGDSDGQAMTSQPSEVQIIFDDALTDLNALVDHLLPVAPDEAGGFADRMMTAIGHVGATATDNICSPNAVRVRGNKGHLLRDHQQPTKVMNESTSGSFPAGFTPIASAPVVPVPASSSTSKRGPSLVNQTMDTLITTPDDSFDTSSTCSTNPIQNTPTRNRQSSKVDTPNVMDEATLKSNKCVPESPSQKVEREADEVAGHIAHRTYRLEKSSLSQLIDQFDNHAKNRAEKQRRLAVINPWLAAAEKKRQEAQQVQGSVQTKAAHTKEIFSTSPPRGVHTNTSYDSDSTDDDALADEFRSMVVSDLD